MNATDRYQVIDATIHDWQMAGDSRGFEKIWPEAEVYVDAFGEKFDELVEAWVAEGMDLHDAQDEAQHYARDAARDALKEFEAGDE